MTESTSNLEKTDSEEPKQSAIGFDLSNPRSVPNLLPTAWRDAVIYLDERWFTYHERHLRRRCEPDRIDNILRNRFWAEYGRAQETGGKMNMDAVTSGVTYKDYIHKVILKKPAKLAWIVRPPVNMSFSQEEALQEGIYQLREAVSRYDDPDFLYTVTTKEYAGNKNKAAYKQVTRKLNVSALAELRKIVESLSMRVQGAITQQVQIAQKVHQVTQEIGAPEPTMRDGLSDLGQLEAMQKNLHKLNSTLQKTQELGDMTQVIEGEVEDV